MLPSESQALGGVHKGGHSELQTRALVATRWVKGPCNIGYSLWAITGKWKHMGRRGHSCTQRWHQEGRTQVSPATCGNISKVHGKAAKVTLRWKKNNLWHEFDGVYQRKVERWLGHWEQMDELLVLQTKVQQGARAGKSSWASQPWSEALPWQQG